MAWARDATEEGQDSRWNWQSFSLRCLKKCQVGRDSSVSGASPTPPQLPSAEVALQPTSALSLCPAQDQLSTEVPRVGGKGLGEELLPPPRVLSRRKSVSSWCCVVRVPVLVAVSMGPLPQSNPKWQHDCCETASQAPCAPPRLVSCRAIPLLFPPPPPPLVACIFVQPGRGRELCLTADIPTCVWKARIGGAASLEPSLPPGVVLSGSLYL